MNNVKTRHKKGKEGETEKGAIDGVMPPYCPRLNKTVCTVLRMI